MNHPTAAFAILITSLVAIGPLSTDFYLPALPSIAAALGTDSAGAQLTLSAYLIGFGFGQLVLGPVSDRYGRRPVLLVSMLVYVGASAACMLAPSIGGLVGARFVQALAACAGPVLGRAIVRDLYGPQEAARMLSYMSAAMALAPLLAPLFGGWLTVAFGWRSTFAFLTAFSAIQVIFVWRMLTETNRHLDPLALQPRNIIANYRSLLADRLYRGVVMVNGFGYAGLFAFISGAAFVFIDHYGFSPQGMGLAFGCNVTGFMLGTVLSGRYSRRVGPGRLLRHGVLLGAVSGVALMLPPLFGIDHPLALMVPMWFITCSTGLSLPNATAIALSAYPHMAGAAASLMGFLQMGLGAVLGVAVGHGVGGSPLPMMVAVAGSMWASALAWRLWVRGREMATG